MPSPKIMNEPRTFDFAISLLDGIESPDKYNKTKRNKKAYRLERNKTLISRCPDCLYLKMHSYIKGQSNKKRS